MTTKTASKASEVPVFKAVLEHIDLDWAGGPYDWVLVRSGETEVSVCDDDYYDGYRRIHGPFSLPELYGAVVKLGKRKPDTAGWDDYPESKRGIRFSEKHGEERMMIRTGDDSLVIVAPCGDRHYFRLSRLKLILRKASKLSIVQVQ